MRPQTNASTLGWVYMWHFSRPLGNPENPRAMAQHYCGFACDRKDGAESLEERAAEHLAGQGACITRAAIANGIEISLVMAWRAPLSFEKQIKRRKDMPRLCPICCAARGRKVKHITVPPAEQLALPLFDGVEPWDDGDFPEPPVLRADWLEIEIQKGWRRSSCVPALAGAGDICEDIPW